MSNNIESLLETIKFLEAEQEALWEQVHPIQEKLKGIYEEIAKLKNQKGDLLIEEMKAENFVPSPGNFFSPKELELVLLGETNSMSLYNHAENLMTDRFNYCFSRYGISEETGQTVFKISLVKGDKERTKLVKEAILYFLPHLIFRTKDNYDREVEPYIRFGIFEHTLSAGGRHFDLVYTKNSGKWSIEARWNSTEYPSLDKALEYIEENLWYERVGKNGKLTSYDEGDDW